MMNQMDKKGRRKIGQAKQRRSERSLLPEPL
jgi:hypothetical protein